MGAAFNPGNLLKKSVGAAQDVATKKIIKQFTEKFEFVYFGRVNPREDEHELVRGITLSINHRDNHYSVGVFHGHDVTLLERRNTFTFPHKPPQDYRWLIMQFDLKRSQLPHIFIDAHHHETVFYANLFAAQIHLGEIGHLLPHHDPQVTKYFRIFARSEQFESVQEVLHPDITAMLVHHFRQFDYEIDDDRIYIYASNVTPSLHLLQEMLRVGLWLSETLNGVHAAAPDNA